MQSRADSLMEAVTNTAIGFILSMVTWHFVALAFGIPMPLGENLKITGIFTIVSLTRAYVLRRAFDGRTVWQAIKAKFARPGTEMWPQPVFVANLEDQAELLNAQSARLRVEQLINRGA